jgi:hypothetical protein
MEQTKYTHEELKNNIFKYSYDTSKYDFQTKLRAIFDNWDNPIEQLHNFFNNKTMEQLTIDNDTKTIFHNKYYNSVHYKELHTLYYQFVKEVVLPLFDCDDKTFVVQKDPSFRICVPNNTAIGFRPNRNDPQDKIGLHCDGDYGHPTAEINFMLTFGKQYGNNSCYAESKPLQGDFAPIEMNYGEFVSFYGNQCRHYNKKNDTGETRISIDFRIMPISNYDPNYSVESLHGHRKFNIGGYFISMDRY